MKESYFQSAFSHLKSREQQLLQEPHNFQNISSIQIQTIDYCNRKCPWCPNSFLKKSKDTLMALKVFRHLLEELQRLNYQGEIHPYLMAEPLCDPRLPDLISLIRGYFPQNFIMVNTNGDLLRGCGDIENLLEAGLNEIRVSLYDKKNEERLARLAEPYREVLFSQLSEVRGQYYNRAGLVNEQGEDLGSFAGCNWVLEKMYFNHKGDAILCCSDYLYQVVYGNIMKMKLDEIWFFWLYRFYRQMHASLRGKECFLCDKCNRIMRHPRMKGMTGVPV